MTLIDGDRIITANLYDDEQEEYTEKKMSIIDHINAYTDEGVTEADVVEQPRWIPVSERLPKDRNWYLGIFKEPDTGWINSIPFICDYVGVKTKATTNDYWILRGLTDSDDRIGDYYFNLECVAWMPLPEPYKAESEEE